MKRRFLLAIGLSFALTMALGCGDSDDDKDNNNPANGGGGTTAGSLTERPNSANVVVTKENVQTVSNEVNTVAWTAFGKAMQTASYGKQAADYTTNLDGEVSGASSGKAVVKGKMVSKMSGTTPTGIDYDFTCTLYDYSDDGKLFLGGTFTYKGAATYSGYTLNKYEITVTGDINFNGTYQGSEKFTTKMVMTGTAEMTYDVTTTVTSGGQTFTTSYKM
ncbi:hypothetical protein LLG96_06025 [bacterium]|nr:hypothetical protein [bacterium]